jgi:hypothetical protein
MGYGPGFAEYFHLREGREDEATEEALVYVDLATVNDNEHES